MPGRVSLEAGEYYAHTRNAFWFVMASICGFEMSLSYQQRSAKLKMAGVAVWDVLFECEREGSLDSNIKTKTEVPNNLKQFLSNHPSIHTIGFNGKAANQIFRRHFPQIKDIVGQVSMVNLPSTSPAHAVLTATEKAKIWAEKLVINPL